VEERSKPSVTTMPGAFKPVHSAADYEFKAIKNELGAGPIPCQWWISYHRMCHSMLMVWWLTQSEVDLSGIIIIYNVHKWQASLGTVESWWDKLRMQIWWKWASDIRLLKVLDIYHLPVPGQFDTVCYKPVSNLSWVCHCTLNTMYLIILSRLLM
jgi:hypothetical protein